MRTHFSLVSRCMVCVYFPPKKKVPTYLKCLSPFLLPYFYIKGKALAAKSFCAIFRNSLQDLRYACCLPNVQNRYLQYIFFYNLFPLSKCATLMKIYSFLMYLSCSYNHLGWWLFSRRMLDDFGLQDKAKKIDGNRGAHSRWMGRLSTMDGSFEHELWGSQE